MIDSELVVAAAPGPAGHTFLVMNGPSGWRIAEVTCKRRRSFDLDADEARALLALPKAQRPAAFAASYHERRMALNHLVPGEGHHART